MQPANQATGEVARVFEQIRKALGTVPDAYVGIGSNSVAALQSLLELDNSLRNGSLIAQEIELVKLAVSEANGCSYCVAAHSYLGARVGLAPTDIEAARHGCPSGNPKHDALTAFARHLVSAPRGTIAPEVVARMRAAGYGDRQIVDVLTVISAITFTNLFNRINNTAIDFPKVD